MRSLVNCCSSHIFAATVIGGKQIINMSVFSFGYVAAFLSINTNKKVLNKFSDGPSSKFQNKNVSIRGVFSYSF